MQRGSLSHHGLTLRHSRGDDSMYTNTRRGGGGAAAENDVDAAAAADDDDGDDDDGGDGSSSLSLPICDSWSSGDGAVEACNHISRNKFMCSASSCVHRHRHMHHITAPSSHVCATEQSVDPYMACIKVLVCSGNGVHW